MVSFWIKQGRSQLCMLGYNARKLCIICNSSSYRGFGRKDTTSFSGGDARTTSRWIKISFYPKLCRSRSRQCCNMVKGYWCWKWNKEYWYYIHWVPLTFSEDFADNFVVRAYNSHLELLYKRALDPPAISYHNHSFYGIWKDFFKKESSASPFIESMDLQGTKYVWDVVWPKVG